MAVSGTRAACSMRAALRVDMDWQYLDHCCKYHVLACALAAVMSVAKERCWWRGSGQSGSSRKASACNNTEMAGSNCLYCFDCKMASTFWADVFHLSMSLSLRRTSRAFLWVILMSVVCSMTEEQTVCTRSTADTMPSNVCTAAAVSWLNF